MYNITLKQYEILGEMFKLKQNYYTHIMTLPTTLKQVFLLPDPVFEEIMTQTPLIWGRKKSHKFRKLRESKTSWNQ